MTETPAHWAPFGAHMPIFLAFEEPITEARFETVVERLCNAADAAYMAGKATTEQYHAWYIALVEWTVTIKMAEG